MARTLSEVDGLRARRGWRTWYASTDVRMSAASEGCPVATALKNAIAETEEYQSGDVIILIDGEGHVRTFNLQDESDPA